MMSRNLFFIFIIKLVLIIGLSSSNVVEVLTKYGKVIGKTYSAIKNSKVDVWYSIPYAKPPVAELRFKNPVEPNSWKGSKNVTSLPNTCIQASNIADKVDPMPEWNTLSPMSEDCLYLSVFVPQPRPKNAAVMFWLYGGSFVFGSSTTSLYDYKTLSSLGNVIIVAPQYRVGVFGFFFSNTSDATGNAGLFDQLLALKWTKENIANFGGDPNKITLFGQSAGAASVGFHVMSSLSSPLFERAILQSGSPTSLWAIQDKQDTLNYCLNIAEKLQCHLEESLTPSVMECLRKIEPEKFFFDALHVGYLTFVPRPIIDGVLIEKNYRKNLNSTYFKSNMSVLIGSNNGEGMTFLYEMLYELFGIDVKKERVISTKVLFNAIKSIMKLDKLDFPDSIINDIIDEYTDYNDHNNDSLNVNILRDIISDFFFTCDINKFSDNFVGHNEDSINSKKERLSKYYFKYVSNKRKNYPLWSGALHGDELYYLFGMPFLLENNFTHEDRHLSFDIITYFTNFAKSG